MVRLPASLALLGLLTAPAAAADAIDDVPFDESVQDARFSLLLGGGVGFQPLYEGSDEYRTVGFPIIAPSFGTSDGPRRFEFRSLDDVRVHLLHFDRLSLGPVLGYRFGRDETDAARLQGLGDIDNGLVAGGFVAYDLVAGPDTRLGLALAISGQVTGDDVATSGFGAPNFRVGTDYGLETDLSLSLERTVSDRLRVTGKLGSTYANGDYMRTYFGVSPAQAANSVAGLSAFDADAGIKDVYLNLGATYAVTERFELRASFGYQRLLGDAADSPVTVDADQFTGAFGAAYRFRF